MIDLAAYRPHLPSLHSNASRLPVRPDMIAVGVVAGITIAVFGYAFGRALVARQRRIRVAHAMVNVPKRRRRSMADIESDAPPTVPTYARKSQAERNGVAAARDD